MQKFLLLILILCAQIGYSQDYALDTGFHYSNPKFETPQYILGQLVALGKEKKLVNAQVAKIKLTEGSVTSFAVINQENEIVEDEPILNYVKNSFTDSSFLTFQSSFYNLADTEGIKISRHFFDGTEPEEFDIYPPFGSFNGISLLKDFLLVRNDSENQFALFDRNGQLIHSLNTRQLNTELFPEFNYYIKDLEPDEAGGLTVLVLKESYLDGSVAHQVYQLKPGETLTFEKLAFEKSRTDLGAVADVYFTDLIGNKVYFEVNEAYGSPIIIKSYTLDGKPTGEEFTIPIRPNDGDSFLEFYKDQIEGKVLMYYHDQENLNMFVYQENELINTFKVPKDVDLQINIKEGLYGYVDSLKEMRLYSLTDSREIPQNQNIPKQNLELYPQEVLTLGNGDYWLGFVEPYFMSNPFQPVMRFAPTYLVKYRGDKEIFRLDFSVNRYFLSGENEILVSMDSGINLRINSNNDIDSLNRLEGTLIYADTVSQNYYVQTRQGLIHRYSYDQELDTGFEMKPEKGVTHLLVAADGKIYADLKRYQSDGTFDPTFASPSLLEATNFSLVFSQYKFGNEYLATVSRCSEGCYFEHYTWKENENIAKKISDPPPFYADLYRNPILRDDKIYLNNNRYNLDWSVDSSFILHTPFRGRWGSPGTGNLVNYRSMALLPDSDILKIQNRTLYKFTHDNPVWVELTDLPKEVITENDSIINTGFIPHAETSDGSAAIIQVVNSDSLTPSVSYSNGKITFTGVNGGFYIKATSSNGATPDSARFAVSISQSSRDVDVLITPRNMELLPDFSPLKINYELTDSSLYLDVVSSGAYLENDTLYSTGQSGGINFVIRKKSNPEAIVYPVNPTNWRVTKYRQEIISEDESFELCTNMLPAVLPITSDAGLPLDFSILKGVYSRIVNFKGDSLKLNPNWAQEADRLILPDNLPHYFLIEFNVSQDGNQSYWSSSRSFMLKLNKRNDCYVRTTGKIYPNPFSSVLWVAHEEDVEVSEIKVFDLSGRMVKTLQSNPALNTSLGLNENKNNVMANYFDTLSIPQGIYLVQYSYNGITITKRLIK